MRRYGAKPQTLPSGLGDFETGCHTEEGNELALYVQTTRSLHEARAKIFSETLAAKRKWTGLSEFNAALRLENPGQQLYKTAVASYKAEIGRDIGGSAVTREDFLRWLAFEYDCYRIDAEIEDRSKVA
jgi:hypothetical protein